MKSKSSMITVGQFAQVEEDSRPGFKTRWIVDKHGCPACGNITKYELKKPAMPAVSVCKHVSGLDGSKSTIKQDIWIIDYYYNMNAISKLRKPQDPAIDIRFSLKENGTKERPVTLRAQREEGILFEESCNSQSIPALVKKIVKQTDSWCISNLHRPLEKCSIIATSTIKASNDASFAKMVATTVTAMGQDHEGEHKPQAARSERKAGIGKMVQSSLSNFFPQEVPK